MYIVNKQSLKSKIHDEVKNSKTYNIFCHELCFAIN